VDAARRDVDALSWEELQLLHPAETEHWQDREDVFQVQTYDCWKEQSLRLAVREWTNARLRDTVIRGTLDETRLLSLQGGEQDRKGEPEPDIPADTHRAMARLDWPLTPLLLRIFRRRRPARPARLADGRPPDA